MEDEGHVKASSPTAPSALMQAILGSKVYTEGLLWATWRSINRFRFSPCTAVIFLDPRRAQILRLRVVIGFLDGSCVALARFAVSQSLIVSSFLVELPTVRVWVGMGVRGVGWGHGPGTVGLTLGSCLLPKRQRQFGKDHDVPQSQCPTFLSFTAMFMLWFDGS